MQHRKNRGPQQPKAAGGVDRWDDLRVFLAVVRGGSLGAAASPLGIDASTVFRRVMALEQSLGTRVFERRGRRWALTPAGELLTEHAARIEEEMEAAHRDVVGRDVALEGTVRVTTPADLGDRLVAAHVAAFRAKNRAITVELLLEDRILDLVRGEADVAIRPRRPPAVGALVGRKVSDLAGALYASRSYLERHGRPRRRSDLARHDAVAVDGALAQTPYGEVANGLGSARRVALRTNALLGVLRAVSLGLGVGPLPCFLGDADADLVRLFPPEPELAAELWLLYHGDLRQTARVRAFCDFMLESLRAQRPLLEGRTR
ncbi:MAG: LysR family transcriptional regulator [Deltaproteobacteria bacterium]|nr:LysR family transcriptional regulator [Deltaproteobacteria bacterium]